MNTATKLCAPIFTDEPPIADQAARAVAGGADLVELRVDHLRDLAAVERFLSSPSRPPAILTIRSAAEGGQWDGDDADRIALIERLGLLLPGFIDIEHATWTRSANLRQKIGLVCDTSDSPPHASDRPRNTLILSHHNFTATPPNLPALCDEMSASAPRTAILKLAFTAADATDALRALTLLRDPPRRMIVQSMGHAGLITRVLCRKFAAFLSFAALDAAQRIVPDQPTLADMHNLYHWSAINTHTRWLGVIGWPVAHSLSPRLHNSLIAEHGFNAVYLPLPVQPTYSALAAFLDFVADNPWLDALGFSVTIPHKEHALRWLDERGGHVSPIARRCGAVNTLTRRPDGSFAGDNTDAHAALAALESAAGSMHARRVAILGTGGAARAVIAALVDRGACVTIFGRDPHRRDQLAREFQCAARDWRDRVRHDCEIVVNATSVGMSPDAHETPLPESSIQSAMTIFDVVYQPLQTQLLAHARRCGARSVDGLTMFAGQAAHQFATWFDTPLDAAATYARLERWLHASR